MKHEELLAKIDEKIRYANFVDEVSDRTRTKTGIPSPDLVDSLEALRAVVELHTGKLNNRCVSCLHGNKCETIQAIEAKLK